MLKFVGSFDKLKDYGFVKTNGYDEKVLFSKGYEKKVIAILENGLVLYAHKHDKRVKNVFDWYKSFKYKHIEPHIQNLIKDGLVIKVDDTK